MEEFGTVPAPGNREEQLMRALVDTAGALIICTAPPEPRTDDRGQPLIDRDTGLPTYVTQVVIVGADRRTAVVRVAGGSR